MLHPYRGMTLNHFLNDEAPSPLQLETHFLGHNHLELVWRGVLGL